MGTTRNFFKSLMRISYTASVNLANQLRASDTMLGMGRIIYRARPDEEGPPAPPPDFETRVLTLWLKERPWLCSSVQGLQELEKLCQEAADKRGIPR